MSGFYVSYVVLWALVCVLLVAVFGLYSAFGASKMLRRQPANATTHGPAIGSEVLWRTYLPAGDHDGDRWIFTSPDCGYCGPIKDNLRLRSPLENTVVVCRGNASDVERWAQDLPDWVYLLPDPEGRVFQLFNVVMTPFYVRLDEQSQCLQRGPLNPHKTVDDYDASLHTLQPPLATAT